MLSAGAIFFYANEKDTYQGLFIFLSTAIFLFCSIAAFDIEKTYVLFNATSGAIEHYNVTTFEPVIGYLNGGLALLSGSIGIIKTLAFRDSQKLKDEEV